MLGSSRDDVPADSDSDLFEDDRAEPAVALEHHGSNGRYIVGALCAPVTRAIRTSAVSKVRIGVQQNW